MKVEQHEYEHQFEDLTGRADDDDVVVDAAGEEDELAGAEPIGGPADQEAPEAADDKAPENDEAEAAESDLDAEIEAGIAAQRETQGRAEIEALRQEVAALKAEREKAASKAGADEANEQIEQAEAAMAAAYEEGDTKAAAKHQRELTRLEIRRQAAEAGEAGGVTEPKPAAERQEVPRAAYRWLSKNEWFYRGGNEEAAIAARAIERALLSRGEDPDTDSFYQKLDGALTKRYPGLHAPPKRRAPTQGPSNGTGAQGAPGRGKVTITAEDKRVMRRFGLDPDNPMHLKEWARESAGGRS